MRHLTQEEIRVLEKNLCTAEDWQQVTVADTFDPETCYDVTFLGKCQIGDLSGHQVNDLGIPIPNGIRHAMIHNCTIGDHVCIHHLHNYISHYDIASNVLIMNVNAITMRGRSSFGVGVEVAVLNETGGYEVPLTPHLSATTAYMLTFMSQNEELRTALRQMVEREQEEIASERGTIEEGVVILNCDTIENAWFGKGCKIEGATLLRNCLLASRKEEPIYIGHDVQGEDFIASAGTRIEGGAVIERCFIGQATVIKHQYSAHDSLFFCNCHLENGEACAIFAGPFSVSSHKSSLLIAGHFSFLNAGSGSNQSNHLYKLGPIHQGVVERGSKTSSDSYVLWPARIGAFSLVMGRHVNHIDTTHFPFSYLIENDNKTYLVPGRNLLSVGTMRDAKKWPARDRRPEDHKMDCVNYNLLSPFTVGKMEVAYTKLKNLYEYLGGHDHVYVYNNLYINATSLRKGLQIYRWGIEKFIGNSLITRIYNQFGTQVITDFAALQHALLPDHDTGRGDWIDMSGMIAPASQISHIKEDISRGQLCTLPEVNRSFRNLHAQYYDLEWDWSYDLLCRWYEIPDSYALTPELLQVILKDWIHAVLTIDEALYNDARKEYSIIGQVNFGIEVEPYDEELGKRVYKETIQAGFDDNDIVKSVLQHMEKKQALYDRVIGQLDFRD